MTSFYYCSVNHQSGLQNNTFSKLSYIFLIHQNVPQIISYHLRYSSVPNRRAVRNKRAGGKILKKL